MSRSSRKILLAAALGALLAIPTGAHASFVADFQGTTALGGGQTGYNYNLRLATNSGTESLVAGDFVTLFDFGGFVGTVPANPATSGLTIPALFTASTQFLGVTAPFQSVFDDPTIANITFVYTGPTTAGDQTFTGFQVVSTLTTTKNMFFSGQDTFTADGTTKLGNSSITTGPAAVPEPTSMALLGIGSAAAFGLVYRRRVKAQV